MLFQSPRNVYFGQDATSQLGDILKSLGVQRPLIVTDKFLSGSKLIERVVSPLKQAELSYAIYDNTMPEPTVTSIDTLREFFSQGNYDGLVAFGGGSAMDSAKALAIMHTYGGTYRQWAVPHTPNGEVLPLVCIPTTAGTGSEVSNACILKEESGEKLVYLGTACVPKVAIIDYEFTLDMPAKLTAYAGIDALAHALESYTSRGANPFSDAMALHAIQLIAPNLRTVFTEPHNRIAREAVMIGATQAGYAFTSAGLTLVHGMSAPVGGLFHVPHGLSNAMLMPTLHRYTLDAALPRYATCARIMGLVDVSASDEEAGKALIEELSALNRDLQVPTMKEFGVDEKVYFDGLEAMSRQALETGAPELNARIPDMTELKKLYEAAWHETWL